MKWLYFVRHCKATGQDAFAELTEEGIQQAEDLVGFFKDKKIELIVSSPFLRAMNTIKPLSDRIHQEIYIDNRLQERILSSVPLDNWLEELERTYIDYDLQFEGGESSNEALSRGLQVIEELLARPERSIVVVTHGALLSLLITHYNSEFGFVGWKNLTNPDVYCLEKIVDQLSMKRIW